MHLSIIRHVTVTYSHATRTWRNLIQERIHQLVTSGREGVVQSHRHVMSRYPQSAANIRRLLLRDQKFREICDDYEAAQEAVERWSHSSDRDANLRTAEFEKVSGELEGEIERFLNERD